MAKNKAKDGSNKGSIGKYDTIAPIVISLTGTTDHNVTYICKTVGIDISTYFEWLRTKPQFSTAIKEAKAARLELLASLAQEETIKRIQGYTVNEEQVIIERAANGESVIREKKVTTKHIKASDTLLMYVNNNRNPENWKHKEHIDHSGEITNTHDFGDMPTKDLIDYIRLQKEARKLNSND